MVMEIMENIYHNLENDNYTEKYAWYLPEKYCEFLDKTGYECIWVDVYTDELFWGENAIDGLLKLVKTRWGYEMGGILTDENMPDIECDIDIHFDKFDVDDDEKRFYIPTEIFFD